jgi:hypothetical protein
MLSMPQDEHLVMKGNPVRPQPVYKVIELPENPKLAWSSQPAAVVTILSLFSSRGKVAAGRTTTYLTRMSNTPEYGTGTS